MTVTIRTTPSAVFNPHISTTPNQTAPATAALTGGGYVTVWRSDGQDDGTAGQGGIYSRLADASGSFVGGENLVNTTTTGSQLGASVEALGGGGYVVSWLSPAAGGNAAYAQRFDSTGAKVGGETLIAGGAGAAVQSVDIAATSDGGFWTVWSGGAWGVSAQRYNAAGATIGGVVVVTANENSNNPVRAAANADGGLLVTWTGRDLAFPFSTPDQVKVRHIDAAGVPGSETVFKAEHGLITHINPTVTALAGGGYVVTWSPMASANVFYQVFDENGAKVGVAQHANTARGGGGASVVAFADGGFAIGWNGPDGVFVQLFSADGTPAGPELQLHARLENDLLAGMTVAVLTDGSVVAGWQDRTSATAGDIEMVRFNAAISSTLSAGIEIATGDDADDVFLASSAAIGAGDRIAGGRGADTLQLTTTGRTDFTGVLLDGLETLRGSTGDDTLVFAGAPAGVAALDSGGGRDVLELAGGVDLADLPGLVGDWTIRAPSGATFTISGDFPTAVFDPSMTTVLIEAPDYALTGAERAALFAGGADRITQPGGLVFTSPTTATDANGQTVLLASLTVGADTIAANAQPRIVATRPQDLTAADNLTGGAAIDRLELSEVGVLDLTAPASFGGFEMVVGSAGDDRFIVSAARLAGVADISGGAGHDAIEFTGAVDLSVVELDGIETVRGSAGDDQLTIGEIDDLALEGGGGVDTLRLSAGLIHDLIAPTFTGFEIVQGTTGDETFRLQGGVQTFRIDGGGGYNVVSYAMASSGAVMTEAHVGVASVDGSAYIDTLRGGAGADVLSGGQGDDQLIGGAGGDNLNGGFGSDVLYGQDGNDILGDGDQTTDRDFLLGASGNDTYFVNSTFTGPTDVVYEGGDHPDLAAGADDVDVVYSWGSFWRDYYSVGEKLYIQSYTGSQMVGGTNDQEIYGFWGDDVIVAYGGSNRIDGDRGNDGIDLRLYDLDETADGVNTVVMKAGNGIDYVYGFESGVDKIDLTAFDFPITSQQVLDQAINVDLAGTVDDHSYIYLTNAGGVQNFIVFMGLFSSQLQAADFIV